MVIGFGVVASVVIVLVVLLVVVSIVTKVVALVVVLVTVGVEEIVVAFIGDITTGAAVVCILVELATSVLFAILVHTVTVDVLVS